MTMLRLEFSRTLVLASLGALTFIGPACDTEAVSVQREPSKPEVASDEPVLHLEPDGSYTYDAGNKTFSAVIYPTGEVAFRDWNEGGFSDVGVKVSGPGEWAQRGTAGVRHAKEKAAFLLHTADKRAKLASTYAHGISEKEVDKLRLRLEALHVTMAEDPAAFRKRVFELWDECLEANEDPALSRNDAERHRQGAAARGIIETFVRERLPEGSERAFSPEELAALNEGRHSKAAFTPYAAPDAAPPAEEEKR